MAYDLLIKNGLIIDGTGKKAGKGSVGITGNKIETVGAVILENAKRIIDAEGKIIAPGFIDATNHSDVVGTLFTNPSLESMVRQGVTTILGGNCGSSLAPLLSQSSIYAFEKWREGKTIPIDWLSMGDFLKTVEKIKLGVNFGTFVGYGTLLRGLSHNSAKKLTIGDFEKLKFSLREALKEGAFGLSTGLVYTHERKTGTEELVDLGRTIHAIGGVYKTHLRSESTFLLGATNEAIRIGREANIPAHISHFKAIGRKAWKEFPRALNLIEKAAESKVAIHFDAYPYITTGSFLYLLLPPGVYEGGFKKLFERLKDPTTRLQVIEALKKYTLHYHSITVSTAWKTKESVGKTILEIAERARISPEETLLHLVIANEGRITIFGRTVRPEQVRQALEHPLSIAATDGSGYPYSYRQSGELVHPRSFGAFPRFLRLATARWQSLSWEDTISKATGKVAGYFGIKKRGILQKGNFADIVIINPETVQSSATFENPYLPPLGIDYVFVNGHIAVENGLFQGARSGNVVRRNEA